jgi:hypothetical protein
VLHRLRREQVPRQGGERPPEAARPRGRASRRREGVPRAARRSMSSASGAPGRRPRRASGRPA